MFIGVKVLFWCVGFGVYVFERFGRKVVVGIVRFRENWRNLW